MDNRYLIVSRDEDGSEEIVCVGHIVTVRREKSSEPPKELVLYLKLSDGNDLEVRGAYALKLNDYLSASIVHRR